MVIKEISLKGSAKWQNTKECPCIKAHWMANNDSFRWHNKNIENGTV